MRMKISLALGKREPLSRQTAWGCFTTNLAMPGFGSLLGGRRSGYPQALLGLGGLALTVVFGLRFILWFLTNWSRLEGAEADPVASWIEVLLALRWPGLGIGVFGLAWLWSLGTSLLILSAAKNTSPSGAPPPLERL